ncbi:MAG TPA: helix-turn-helix domain-containing protein [Dehalococcoidia bacterium]|nr:helix-turn-helix domain-containing protein [Dehalococcoidia bacterium]
MVTKSPLSVEHHDIYETSCQARGALARIADKWAVLLVLLLQQRPYRFNEMRRTIEGLSQKMLTQTLRNLERDGLVLREGYSTTPPQVEYSLTPLGQTLCAAVSGMREWTETHVDDVLAAQAAFDARAARPLLPK